MSVASATAKSRRASDSRGMDVLARLGLAARGALYLLVGVLALMVAFGHKAGESDQRGAMEELTQHTGGSVVLLLVAIGLAGYALWRLSEAAFGVSGEGNKAVPRLQSLGRGIVYGALAVSAFTILAQGHEGSQAKQQQSYSARIMHHTAGRWLIGLIGVVIVVVGVVLVYRGLTRSFEKHFKLGEMSHASRRATEFFGVVGTAARGVVFGITGVLLAIAAVQFDPKKARGIDGALMSLRDTPVGPWLLVVVALGLVMFGLFGLCEARWRHT